MALAFLAAGVIVARRRSVALVAAGLALTLVAAILIGFAVGHALFITSVSPGFLPTGVSEELLDRVAGIPRSPRRKPPDAHVRNTTPLGSARD